MTVEDLEVHRDLNMRFHEVIVKDSHKPVIADALALALAVDCNGIVRAYRRFNYTHMQHHSVFYAPVNRQRARAEAIMREHANATLRYVGSAAADERMKVILRSQ